MLRAVREETVMRLTSYTDYAFRLLMYVALRGDRLSTIEEIAGAYDISRNHLMKVAQALSNGGFLYSLRGRTGGLRLARPAADIRLGDVIRTTEEDMALVTCFRPVGGGCSISPFCGLKFTLNEALDAFMDVMDRTTLADISGSAVTVVYKSEADARLRA